MDSTLTQQRNRLQSPTSANTTSSTTSAPAVVANVNNAQTVSSPSQNSLQSQSSSPPERTNSTSSFANLLDGFTSRVSGDRSQSTVSTPSSTNSSVVGGGAVGGGGSVPGIGGATGSIASLTSIGSLGTTANAFYSSIGLAFNSLTSPITAAAAAATATTAEAAAVVVAAASAISNHLSSPTSGTPPNLDDLDDDEDCDDDDDDGHVPAPTPKKSWSEIKATVNDLRKQLSNLSSLVPTNIQFRTLSDGRVRCYFLSTPPNAWETTLLYVDVNLVTVDVATAVGSNAGIGNESGVRMGSSPSSQGSSPSSSSGFSHANFSKRYSIIIRLISKELKLIFFSMLRLQWNIVLQQPISSVAAAAAANSGVNAWSREFQLLQERKRLSTWGITSYELHKPSGKIVFPCFSDLYQCLDTGYNVS